MRSSMEARKLGSHERAHRTIACDVAMDVASHLVCDVCVSSPNVGAKLRRYSGEVESPQAPTLQRLRSCLSPMGTRDLGHHPSPPGP